MLIFSYVIMRQNIIPPPERKGKKEMKIILTKIQFSIPALCIWSSIRLIGPICNQYKNCSVLW